LNSLSFWERVGERAFEPRHIVNYVPLPQPFSQREKGERARTADPEILTNSRVP